MDILKFKYSQEVFQKQGNEFSKCRLSTVLLYVTRQFKSSLNTDLQWQSKMLWSYFSVFVYLTIHEYRINCNAKVKLISFSDNSLNSKLERGPQMTTQCVFKAKIFFLSESLLLKWSCKIKCQHFLNYYLPLYSDQYIHHHCFPVQNVEISL